MYIISSAGAVVFFFFILIVCGIGIGDGLVQFMDSHFITIITVLMLIALSFSISFFITNLKASKNKFNKIKTSSLLSYIGVMICQTVAPIPIPFYIKEVFGYWDRLKTSFWVFVLFPFPLLFLSLSIFALLGVFGYGYFVQEVSDPEKPIAGFFLCLGLTVAMDAIIVLFTLWVSTFWR